MTDTKRLLVLIIVVLWCLASLPFAHAQQCGEDKLAANTIVIKKKAVASVPAAPPAGVAQVGTATNAQSSAEDYDGIATASRTLGTGANRALFACISFYNSPSTISVASVTFDAGGANQKSFSKLGDVGGDMRAEIWYATGAASGAAGTVTVLFSDYPIWGSVSVTEWTGVDQTTPLENYSEAEGESTTPTVNVSSEVGTKAIDCMASTTNSATQGAGQTAQMNQNSPDNIVWIGSSVENGAATVTMSWTIDDTYWKIAAASINPS